jgi:hypothetical protein
MKITMYELLGLVKDGKAPKEIKFGNIKLKYNEGCEDYYLYYGTGLFEYKFRSCKNFLNDEVEIIEELKKIEKCKNYEDFLGIDDYIEHLKNKIDELIDEINNLKEND